MAARLKETYKSEVAPALMKKFGYKSVMQIPKLDKIVETNVTVVVPHKEVCCKLQAA